MSNAPPDPEAPDPRHRLRVILSSAVGSDGAVCGRSTPTRGGGAGRALAAMLALVMAAPGAHAAEAIGDVDTVFKFFGPDHKILVEAYDDPGVAGVTCYVSRAKTGGISGGLWLAEDKSEASIACRAVGPVSFARPLKRQEEIFTERTSLVFKRLRVVRMVDARRNTLVYLSYSDRVIEGSPQNSVTAVPVDRSTPIPLR